MKAEIFDEKGIKKEEMELPKNFNSKIRRDILLKVFEAKKLELTQPYGAKKGAGAQYSASGILNHRRHVWKTTYGRGISRIPRKIFSRSGATFNWAGATVSNTRGGRRAHPPKPEKNNFKKINKKEFLIALNSALSGTLDKEVLKEKYGKDVKSGLVFKESILSLKTKEFFKILKKLLGSSFDRILKKKKIRAGIGKQRGRKYKSSAGMLFVISDKQEMNRKGIDVVKVSELTLKDLAPNGTPGRITCYTEEAIKEIGERFK